jgi:CarD family transcriptional regulator
VIGVRGILSRQEVCSLLEAIPGLPVEANSNWNKRYQENMQRLKSGNLYEVARVIKSLMHRDVLRGLSTGELKMLHDDKQIVISEIVLVEASYNKEIATRLDGAMMQTPVAQ